MWSCSSAWLFLIATALAFATQAFAVAMTLGEQDFADGACVIPLVLVREAQRGEPAPIRFFLGSDISLLRANGATAGARAWPESLRVFLHGARIGTGLATVPS